MTTKHVSNNDLWLERANHIESLELENAQLREDLAEREAEILALRKALSDVNGVLFGEQLGFDHDAFKEALDTLPPTSYLEQWEREKYGEPVAYEWVEPEKGICISHQEPPEYEVYQVKPLYARKEK
jgi:hypothetical protein